MHHKITHAMVGIVAGALVLAAILFSLIIGAMRAADTGVAQARAVIPAISHPVDESMADCTRCHATSRLPRSHASYGAGTCLTCHQVAASHPSAAAAAASGAQTATDARPAATAASGQAAQPEATPVPAGPRAAPVPHPAGMPYTNCVVCHAIGGNQSMPDNHKDYANESCTGCHKGPDVEDTGATTGGVGPAIPHGVEPPYTNCEMCHAPGDGKLAVPANHAGFTSETCTNCHQPKQ
jgi:hypothetical protein